MHIFDEIRVQNLESRQLQLTMLASMTIAVLATGVAILMYPAIFSQDILVSRQTFRFAFYGFCILSALLVGYLWDRQITIRRLTQQVQSEQQRSGSLRLRACNDLLNTIQGSVGFHEHFSAHGRQAGAGTKLAPLSVAVVRLYPTAMVSDKTEERAAFGDAAQVIHRRLRPTDAMFMLSSGVFGVILPGMDKLSAQRLAASLDLGLQDAAGVDSRFTADIQVLNSADNGNSSQGLEHAVSSLLPQEAIGLQR